MSSDKPQGQEGFAAVRVTHEATGASIVVHPQGATLMSWMPAPAPENPTPHPSAPGTEVLLDSGKTVRVGGTGDVLFVSKDTRLQSDKAIRGGVPIAFPQFAGEGSLPNHGFARTSQWTVAEKADGKIVLTLAHSAQTQAVWNRCFKLEMCIEFDDAACHSTLSITNTSDSCDDSGSAPAPMEPQALLRTYYRVQSIDAVAVEHLEGLTYEDKVQDFAKSELKDKRWGIKGETDCIFHNAAPDGKKKITLDSGSGMWRHITFWAELCEKQGGDASAVNVPCDVVVWNPWIEKAKAMGDFGDDEYQHMICVEPGCVRSKPTIPPGATLKLHQIIALE